MEALLNSMLGQGPVYIYNGVSNLRELKEADLNGAKLFFNGKFSIEDLQQVDLVGATVFLNGQLEVRISMPENRSQLIVTAINSNIVIYSQTKLRDV